MSAEAKTRRVGIAGAAALAMLALLTLSACGPHNAAPAAPWTIRLSTNPDPPAFLNPTIFQVMVTDRGGQPVTGAKVTLDLTMTSMDMEAQVPLHEQSGGLYTGSGHFTMAGSWNCQVTVTAAGRTQIGSFPVTALPLK